MIYYDDDYATNGNYELCEFERDDQSFLGLTCALTDLTKHFWTYKHFGNFVKRAFPTLLSSLPSSLPPFAAGSSLHPITNTSSTLLNSTIVVGTPSDDAFNVISMNPTTEDVQIELSFSACVEPTAAYRTSAEENFAELEAGDVIAAGEEGWVLTLSATSQMTFVFGVVDC